MKLVWIEELNKLGFVKAFAVPKDQARWRIYSHDVEAGMEDLKYYKELGESFDIKPDDMVRVPQKHSSDIRVVTKDVAGEGVVKQEIEGGVDGSITNVKGIMLLTIEADCTPVYIVDPVHKAIGMVHSGWRGTVHKITENAINLMKKNYGTDVNDLIIHFGPAICGDCYEVGEDLIPEHEKVLDSYEIKKVFKPLMIDGRQKVDDGNVKKYLLDVTECIRLMLLKIGVKEKNMTRSTYCTYHDNIFDSWRREKVRTKQMLTGIILQ